MTGIGEAKESERREVREGQRRDARESVRKSEGGGRKQSKTR